MKNILAIFLFVLCVQGLTIPPLRVKWEPVERELVKVVKEAECNVDSDCPQVMCIRFPCPAFVCQSNTCVFQEPKQICIKGGCSGQLCVSYYEDAMSTCEWRDYYECYQTYGNCTEIEGKCQWEQSKDLLSCIEDRK